MKIVVYNLGCKVNGYEGDSILHVLCEMGYEVSSLFEWADAYILNTCAVTSEAEKKSRQAVARARKFNPDAVIIVCGCASQNNAEQFLSKQGVTLVTGVANKANIPKILMEKGILVQELPKVYEDNLATLALRTRAYVKIQDGCNNFCSYCLIPYLRGVSRSRPVQSILDECVKQSENIYEIVLTGINLSSYGIDIGSNLTILLNALKVLKIRIRLGSLEVNVIDESLLSATRELFAFCPHFHLSLQSGCDKVLAEMNRHYTTQEFFNKTELIRKFYPQAAITTDLICGFPTETEQDFLVSLDFIDKVKFSDMHIFAYSPRRGTKAFELKMLNSEIVRNRCKRAEKVASKNKIDYLQSFIGKETEVLCEDGGAGYNREYIRIYCNIEKSNEIIKVVPTQLFEDGLK